MSWDPNHWSRTRKIILGIATVWPPVYLLLFMAAVFSMMVFFGLRSTQFKSNTENIDLIQLDLKLLISSVATMQQRKEAAAKRAKLPVRTDSRP